MVTILGENKMLEILRYVQIFNARFGDFIYRVKSYKLQIFLLGFYQINIGIENWIEIIFKEVVELKLGNDNDFWDFNQENFWKIISGEHTPHFNKEVERMYYEKLPKYIARHPKANCFAISQVINDFGRDY